MSIVSVTSLVLAPFQYAFVQRGLLEVVLLSVGAGLLGTWIVLRGLAFYSHAVGTAAFPGLVLADGLGFSAPLGAFAAALAFAFGVERLARSRRERLRQPDRARARRRARARGDPRERRLPLGRERRHAPLREPAPRSGRATSSLAALVERGRARGEPAPRPPLARDRVRRGQRAGARGPLGGPGRGAARPGRARDRLGALGDRRAARDRALRRPRGDGAAADAAAAALAGRLGRARRGRGRARALALRRVERPAGRGDRRARRRRSSRSSRPSRRVSPSARAARAGRRGAAARSPAAARAAQPRAACRSSRRRRRSATGPARSAARTRACTRSCSRTPTRTSTSRGRPTSRRPRGAKLVLENGDGLDGWMAQGDLGGRRRADRRRPRSSATRVPERRPEASRYDPHWWHDPRNAIAAVGEIRDALVARRPGARRARTGAHAAAYVAKLRALDRRHRRVHRDRCRARSASSSPTTTRSATSPRATGSRSSAP